MACCFGGSRAAAEQYAAIEALEEEQQELQTEKKRLHDAIRQEEETKRKFQEETRRESDFARREQAAAEAAEREGNGLYEELQEIAARRAAKQEVADENKRTGVHSSGRRTVQFEGEAAEANQSHGPVTSQTMADDSGIFQAVPPPAESPGTAPAALAEAWQEAEKLMREIAHLHAEVEGARNRSMNAQLAPLEEAEAAAAEMREEVAQARRMLSEAEEEGLRLEDEHQVFQNEEEPLQDWVEHVERELRLARAENSELAKAVIAASDERSRLQRDELEAFPNGSPSIASQVSWLQEQDREKSARKAVLLQEISEQRLRRERYLEEAASCRKACEAHQPVTPATKVPSVPHIASERLHTTQTNGYSEFRQLATDISNSHFESVSNSSARANGPNDDRPGRRGRSNPSAAEQGGNHRTISPNHAMQRTKPPLPRQNAPLLPTTLNFEEPGSPLLASPTPLADMLARGYGQDLHPPQNASGNSSAGDKDSGDHGEFGYWAHVHQDSGEDSGYLSQLHENR